MSVSQRNWTLFIDGASRGNPGPAGAGALLSEGEARIDEASLYLGRKTNNQAEYFGLLLGLWRFMMLNKDRSALPTLTICADSELLVKQMQGYYRLKNVNICHLGEGALSVLATINHQLQHVLREKNKEADRLANQGIDLRKKPDPDFISFLSTLGITI